LPGVSGRKGARRTGRRWKKGKKVRISSEEKKVRREDVKRGMEEN
jgi:hypothetical protein